MPGIDGPSALKALRDLYPAECGRLPIVACTANAVAKDLEGYLSMGFSGCLTKPIDRADLSRVLARFCPEQKRSKATSQTTRDPSVETGLGAVHGIDLIAMNERFEGDRDAICEILNIFLAESAGLLEQVRRAVHSADPEMIRWSAHALKGSLGNVCATAAYSVAETLENDAKRSSIEITTDSFRRLEPLVGQVQEYACRILSGSVELVLNHPT